jgi:hypothetical protein
MSANDLAKVAADVAEALELGRSIYMSTDATGKPFSHYLWAPKGLSEPMLNGDGSNLTCPDWFMRCVEWLTANPEEEISLKLHESRYWPDQVHDCYKVKCPIEEAPARLVSAVWRRRK